MNLTPLIERLKQSEGWSEHVYVDTTSNLTIGFGHNLAHIEVFSYQPLTTPSQRVYKVEGGWVRLTWVNGLPRDMGEVLLIREVTDVINTLSGLLPWYHDLDEVRREVFNELCFNIGLDVLKYKVFITQLRTGQYAAAAANMENWRWRKQVGDGRALPLIKMMRTGERP